jgi:DNA-binding NtrC family response regulator
MGQTRPEGGAAPRILIIDDERSILDTVQILLRGEGFDVTTSHNPARRCRRCRRCSRTWCSPTSACPA